MTLHTSNHIVIPTNLVIPTGDSLSDKERESEWRDLVFAVISVECRS